MKITKLVFIIFCAYAISCVSVDKRIKTDKVPDLPLEVWNFAKSGWDLYKSGDFKGFWNGGSYTDPNPDTKVYDFWSNGVYAKYDRDNNGHFESFFIIRQNQLHYVGTASGRAIFEEVAPEFDYLAGVTIGVFIDLCAFSLSRKNLEKRFKVETSSELLPRAWELARNGWALYEERDIKSSYSSGHYTDPDPNTKVRDFWTNGVIARVDRDDNGSHETVFIISNGKLKYVGTIGGMRVFEAAAPGFEKLLGKSLRELYIKWFLLRPRK